MDKALLYFTDSSINFTLKRCKMSIASFCMFLYLYMYTFKLEIHEIFYLWMIVPNEFIKSFKEVLFKLA